MFCAYPLAVVVSANVGTLPLDMFVIGRSMLVALVAIILIVRLLKRFQPDVAARAMWMNWVLLVLTFYESALQQWRLLGFTTGAADPRFAVIYVFAALSLATVVSQPWKAYKRNPIPLNLFAAALLGATLYPVAAWGMTASLDWRQPADALIKSALSASVRPTTAPARDIYYLILDGMGRRDTLAELYDVDLSALVTFLKDKGFYVADASQSNYAQTYLSLASTLNMNYLDDVAGVMRNSRDRHPLDYLVQNNALMQAARKSGYQVVGISSDYLVTERWDGADICLCPRYGLDELEQRAIWKTPLAALPLGRWTYGAHRRKVAGSLESIGEFSSQDHAPVFVLAHVIAPHPPFVFGPDGSPRQPPQGVEFDFSDGNHFLGSRREYISGYRDQTQFVTRELIALVESLLKRSGTPPVIVIHGDHGPGAMLDWKTARGTNMRERMSIFAAYYFPDSGPVLYPDISPVNGARTLATRYLGLQLPLLADKSFFSTWDDPYGFIPVEPSAR